MLLVLLWVLMKSLPFDDVVVGGDAVVVDEAALAPA